jgi:hypothetical protein
MTRPRRSPARALALIGALMLVVGLWAGCAPATPSGLAFTFDVAADMRDLTGPTEFRGVARAVARAGVGAFMISPGDIDPPAAVYDVVRSELGASYPWYPVVGNHEAETVEDMAWLRSFNSSGNSLPGIVNPGPTGSLETCYSFDCQNAHFIVINEYFNGLVDNEPTGDVSAALYTWLSDDLANHSLPITFVIGHEPAFPQPDMDPPHRLRHEGDSLDQFPTNRNAFWALLAANNVKAYICGHTHNYSAIKIDGVWQVDTGHTRGTGDTGAPSTFIKISVWKDNSVTYAAWRLDSATGQYKVADSGVW